jgi:prolyl oligopeptidase
MRVRHLSFLLVIVSLLALMGAQVSHEISATTPPKTEVKDFKETVQGMEIVDPYRWLEDQESPETRAWIDRENAYTDATLSKIPGREEVVNKLSSFLKIEVMSAPVVRGDRQFFSRRAADQDQASLYVRRGADGKEDLLIDPLALNPEHTTTVLPLSFSQDGKLMAYALRQGGEDEVSPRLMDVDTHKDLADKFPRARYAGFSLVPDKSGIFYAKVTPDGPRVYSHKMGTNADQDGEIFGKGYTADKYITTQVSEDGHYLTIEVGYGSAAVRSELYFKDLKTGGPITPVENKLVSAFEGQVAGDKMFIRTNWNAPKWRIMVADLKKPARDNWREVVPQGNAVIEGFTLAGGKLIVEQTENVVNKLRVLDTDGKLVREVTPPTLGSMSNMNGRWSQKDGYFTFTSFHVPPTIYKYDIASGKQSVYFQPKIPIQTDQYEVKQVWYPSKDGTKIPMFLAYAKGLKLDGANPTLLTGYGGFNIASTPAFSAMAATWMAKGGVWALANMRGGGEFGEEWHHAGMLVKKQNVFDDFIAAGEWLIANKYTSSQKLAIRGGSNGGLLMGAMLTQRPDLFGAVICNYPLLDMVRYQKFLVARYWVSEYGSSDDPEQFKYIYAYSPYHHVKAGTKYPATLFVSGDADTRVAPLHARKMTALMQAANGSDKPIMLHYETKLGHSGGTPVGKQVTNTADELMFLFWQLGVTSQQQTASGGH